MCLQKCRNIKTAGKLESNPEKAGVTFCGSIAFIFTITFTILYLEKWLKAIDMGDEYYCTDFRV